LPFSIDFDRRPYNTLALPCECVIIVIVMGYVSMTCEYTIPMIDFLTQLIVRNASSIGLYT